MTKVLLDQGLPRTSAGLLREIGWDVQHVSERGMSQAEDVAIIELARQEQRVVVTLDADFHAFLAVSGASGPSVVRIRSEGLKAAQIATLLQHIFAVAGNEMAGGAMVTVLDEKIRIKHLPIVK